MNADGGSSIRPGDVRIIFAMGERIMNRIIAAAAAAGLLGISLGAAADDAPQFCGFVGQALAAADQGNADGQALIGAAYYSGYCAYQDYDEAVKWFRKAAAKGDAEAQYMLGRMYAEGQSVDKSDKEAESWFSMACYSGERRGCGEIFREVMTAAEPIKQQVELCAFDLEALKDAKPNPDTGATSCSSNTGERARGTGWNIARAVEDVVEGSKYVRSVEVQDGVIKVNSKNIEMGGTDSFTAIFVPAITGKPGEWSDSYLTWKLSPESTCKKAGIC